MLAMIIDCVTEPIRISAGKIETLPYSQINVTQGVAPVVARITIRLVFAQIAFRMRILRAEIVFEMTGGVPTTWISTILIVRRI